MAEETNSEHPNLAAEEMDLEPVQVSKETAVADEPATNGDPNSKRAREEENDDISKKQKVSEGEKSVEEERLEKKLGEGDEPQPSPVQLGPKTFSSSVEMFDYFFKFLHYWPPNLNINEYEHMVLLDLLKKGHAESDKKIGGGVKSFQVRFHPMWKSRCFFLIRNDESTDDFSFRKCVDRILPLPEDLKIKAGANKALSGGKGRGGRGGGGRGGGRGNWRGRSRN
ncbi:hypothetical protein F8388_002637 [Cannabis sativa]|uniref:Uncharacterized protein n=1 Tax=Cannabis sativa TaxID=3483 RepID=A0A7J6HXS6_CANSA|nr:hypothetical protein F8388_002637 [Cannabis sativa]KAF4399956.1 hypothetical protein G4B88_021170 [Cannabis sativa]KAF4401316.1 hypothetical protein G4B88_014157 [Cannabis sativa]